VSSVQRPSQQVGQQDDRHRGDDRVVGKQDRRVRVPAQQLVGTGEGEHRGEGQGRTESGAARLARRTGRPGEDVHGAIATSTASSSDSQLFSDKPSATADT
jgi:hypothetical protein